MPRYEFKNNETGEIYDEIMSYEDKLLYLKDNPHIQTTYTGMNIVSGLSRSEMGDGGMKEVFHKIADKHPNSPLAERYGKKTIRKLKAKRAYDKHKNRNS
tara:strand:+ start:368 stop:667 length:300 start_codon:yes stop_codon:yes gene_type:complete